MSGERVMFRMGDLLPWVVAAIPGEGRDFGFNRLGGAPSLVLALGGAGHAATPALHAIAARRALFERQYSLVILSNEELAPEQRAIVAGVPGLRLLTDESRVAGVKLGAVARVADAPDDPRWILADRALRIRGLFPIDAADAAIAAFEQACATPAPDSVAPVLAIPDVLDPAMCQRLIAHYEADGGRESGMMVQMGGKTVGVLDPLRKRRRDCDINDPGLRDMLRMRVQSRIVPMIRRAYQFEVTRIERYIVACYEGEAGGHFAAHRDNTTSATAHRRFAVTINLNGDFDGGELCFPEFGERTYRAEPGGAIVFSCTLLHEARRVTAGRRYATLPFLYDEAGARIREANAASLEGNAYRADNAVPAAGS